MSSPCVIEVGGAQVGLVVRDESGFRFFAAGRGAPALEGRSFRTPAEAERAARLVLAARSGRMSQTSAQF